MYNTQGSFNIFDRYNMVCSLIKWMHGLKTIGSNTGCTSVVETDLKFIWVEANMDFYGIEGQSIAPKNNLYISQTTIKNIYCTIYIHHAFTQ